MCIHSTLDHWLLPKHLQLGLVSHSFKMTPLLVLLQPLQQPICNTLVLHHLTSNALLDIIFVFDPIWKKTEALEVHPVCQRPHC